MKNLLDLQRFDDEVTETPSGNEETSGGTTEATAVEGTVAPVNNIAVDDGTDVTTTGTEIQMPEKDLRTVIVLVNTAQSAVTATLLAPAEDKRSYAGADTDVAVEIGAGKIALVPIESAKYATKDLIVKIKASAEGLKVACFKRWEN